MSEIFIVVNAETPMSPEYKSRANAIAAARMDIEHLEKAKEALNKALESGAIKIPPLKNGPVENGNHSTKTDILDVLNTYSGGQKADIVITLGEDDKAQKFTVPVTHDNIERVANAMEKAAAEAIQIKSQVALDKIVTMKDVQAPVFDSIKDKLSEFKGR